VHTYNTKKSETITGKAAILEPQFQTNIWVASVDATQKRQPGAIRGAQPGIGQCFHIQTPAGARKIMTTQGKCVENRPVPELIYKLLKSHGGMFY